VCFKPPVFFYNGQNTTEGTTGRHAMQVISLESNYNFLNPLLKFEFKSTWLGMAGDIHIPRLATRSEGHEKTITCRTL
jgi:hypothetical protein